MTKEEKLAEEFANNGYALGCTKTPFESAKEGFLAGLKAKTQWTDLKIGDVIQNESGTHSMMVIGIDYREESKSHILTGACWLDNDDLNYWKKVE